MLTDFRTNVDLDRYYGDTLTPDATLSQSTANTLLRRSPKHAWAQHPRFGGRPRASSPEMELGNIIDELVIGGSRRIQEVPFDEYRSNAAKAARDAALADGKIPVKASKLADYREAADRVVKELERAGIAIAGMQTQVCLLWVETASNGNPVQCKALLDLLELSRGVIRDLKTSKDCHPEKLARKCIDFGYDVQSAAYINALEHVIPDLVGRVRFENIWMEVDWPHVVTVTAPDGEMLVLGRAKWQRAVDQFEECVRTKQWPAYAKPGEVLRLSPPAWALTDEMFAEDGDEEDDDAAA